MSQAQSWPLSHKANKQSGVCSVCFAKRQLHQKDGTVHQHGPRQNPCPGSNKLPVGILSTPSAVSQSPAAPNFNDQSLSQLPIQAFSQPTLAHSCDTATCAAISDSNAISTTDTPAHTLQHSIGHPIFRGPIIKHIPRSARSHIARELNSILHQIVSHPDDPEYWSALLSFGPSMLQAPPRSGRRHNLTSVLLKRTFSSSPPCTEPPQFSSQHHPKKKDSNNCLASAVMAKI